MSGWPCSCGDARVGPVGGQGWDRCGAVRLCQVGLSTARPHPLPTALPHPTPNPNPNQDELGDECTADERLWLATLTRYG